MSMKPPQPGARAPKRLAFGMRNRMDERYDFVRTVSDGSYRYIRNYMPHRPMAQVNAFPLMLRSYQDLYRRHQAGRWEGVFMVPLQ